MKKIRKGEDFYSIFSVQVQRGICFHLFFISCAFHFLEKIVAISLLIYLSFEDKVYVFVMKSEQNAEKVGNKSLKAWKSFELKKYFD